jgi:hypothetical protein
MKYPEEISSCSNNFQARISAKLQWFAIPMTANRLCETICVTILPPAKPLPIAAAMLQQKDSPCRPTNSLDFFERRHGIWKRACRER